MTTVPSPVREPAWSLPRSAIGLWATEGVIGAVLLWLGIGGFLLFVPASAGGPVPVLRWLLPVLGVVQAVVSIGISPRIKHRVHRWEITAEAAYTRTGWLTQTWTLVPVSRIQTVDVTRGVLQQLFGLATVAVLTASSQGTVRIWHLEHDVAQRVADDLARRAELVRDHAT
ncbi:PH domain-containing protein [Blastococcus capsensis]|uniref:PH domain-containing protein n=1 Tax=Blastococcus capsensis TaxID=1564163 RepID=UPI00253FFEA1|nr:PH domain-containing protein [Blastococcus capsensis]MDK3258577.1 PH domain-containing protein [Blastococcus capsensis]